MFLLIPQVHGVNTVRNYNVRTEEFACETKMASQFATALPDILVNDVISFIATRTVRMG